MHLKVKPQRFRLGWAQGPHKVELPEATGEHPKPPGCSLAAGGRDLSLGGRDTSKLTPTATAGTPEFALLNARRWQGNAELPREADHEASLTG